MSKAPSLFDLRFGDTLDAALEAGHAAGLGGALCGVDEAGRGPWAGPVVTAAVILDYSNLPVGLNDSKKLTESRRNALYDEICATAFVSVASSSAATIDRMNIRAATLDAMRRAVAGLSRKAGYVLVDGRDVPPGLGVDGQALIKGDGRCLAIAAASIVAKVTRDRMMTACGANDNRYGFEIHMGYATARHRAAIVEHGASIRIHRVSFAPFKD